MVTILEPITNENQAVQKLVEAIRQRKLSCQNEVIVEGDHRFWGVDDSITIVQRFRALAIQRYEQQTGRQPEHTIIMANHISAQASPNGSGGGWHVDSIRNQYKLFMYLTDCTRTELGPLTIMSIHPIFDRIAIAVNYITGHKLRFTDKCISILTRFGFQATPILLPRLTPFFVNTSYIHRGWLITEADRFMLTAYIFDKTIPESIAKRALAREQ